MAAINRPIDSPRHSESPLAAAFPKGRTSPQRWRDLRRILLPAFITLALLSLLQVHQAGGLTGKSYNISKLEQTRQEWSAQVRQLEAEVASLTALDRIEREASHRLGLVPAPKRIYLDVPVPLSNQQHIPRRYLANEVATSGSSGEEVPLAQDDSGEPWWQSLIELLPLY